MTTAKDLPKLNMTIVNLCKIQDRTWPGYAIDIITMGGYTTWRVNEYSKCVLENRTKILMEFRNNASD